MRLLLLSPNTIRAWNWGHQLFRDEIGRHADTTYVGHGHPHSAASLGSSDLPYIIDRLGPFDAVISYDGKYCGMYSGWDAVTIPKICIMVDYFDRNAQHPTINPFVCTGGFDLVVLRAPYCEIVFNRSKKHGQIPAKTKSTIIPFGADVHQYRRPTDQLERDIDVTFIGATLAWAYPARVSVANLVRSMRGRNTLVAGTGSRDRILHRRYVDVLHRSKIFVIANGVYNCVTFKYYEAMICGAVVLAQKPRDAEFYGFKHLTNIVYYDIENGIMSLVNLLLDDTKLLNKIADNAFNFIMHDHTMAHRVQLLLKEIQKL